MPLEWLVLFPKMLQSEQNCSKTERLPQSFRPCSISLGFGTTRPAPRGGVHEKAVAIAAQSCDRNPATSAHAPTIEGQGWGVRALDLPPLGRPKVPFAIPVPRGIL